MLAKTNSWPSCQRPQEKIPVRFAKYKSARGSLSWIQVQLCASKGFIHFTSKPFYKPDIIMSREKNAKQKAWCAAASLLAKLEGRKRAVVRPPIQRVPAVPTDRTASVTLRIAIAPCRSLPAHHNIVTFHFFPSQGHLFSLIQDPALMPPQNSEMCLLVVSGLAIAMFTLLLDRFSCCQKNKCIQP